MVALDVLAVVGLCAAYGAQMLRWLRVLQREHYEASALARFVGRWSSPQMPAIPKSKVQLEQSTVAVRAAPLDEFVGASQYEQDRWRPKPPRGERRPFTLSHALIIAFIVALLTKNEAAPVVVAIVYGLLAPWGLSIKGRTGPLVWTRRLDHDRRRGHGGVGRNRLHRTGLHAAVVPGRGDRCGPSPSSSI